MKLDKNIISNLYLQPIFGYQMKLRAFVVVFEWWLDLQLPAQSVPITTKIVSLNPALRKVYSIQDM